MVKRLLSDPLVAYKSNRIENIPKWMTYYDRVAYLVLVLDVLFPLGYLAYTFMVMNDRKMYLPYSYPRMWLELNSYSLIPPFCAIPVAPMLIWQVKNRVQLSDGDMYGTIGTMLGFGAVSLFDSTLCLRTYIEMTNGTNPENTAEALREAMYKGVSGTIYQDYRYTLSGSNDISFVYEHLVDGYRVEDGTGGYMFLLNPDNRTAPLGGGWTSPIINDQGIRLWTHTIQKYFTCCGSINYKDWTVFNGEIYSDMSASYPALFGPMPPSCYCNYQCRSDEFDHEKCFVTKMCKHSNDPASESEYKSRPGCFQRYFAYVQMMLMVTAILQLIMGLLYITTILVYIFNFAALRFLETVFDEDIADTFSLLRNTSSEDLLELEGARFGSSRRNTKDTEKTSDPDLIKESLQTLKLKKLLDPNYQITKKSLSIQLRKSQTSYTSKHKREAHERHNKTTTGTTANANNNKNPPKKCLLFRKIFSFSIKKSKSRHNPLPSRPNSITPAQVKDQHQQQGQSGEAKPKPESVHLTMS